jgi:hypothetical protein
MLFRDEELLATLSIGKLENHPLSAIRCLFNLFTATFRIQGPPPHSAAEGSAMALVTRGPFNVAKKKKE